MHTSPRPRPFATGHRALVTLAALALALAACGGGEDTDDAAPPASASEAVDGGDAGGTGDGGDTDADADAGADEEGAATDEAPDTEDSAPLDGDDEDGDDSVYVTVAGEEFYADLDSVSFACFRLGEQLEVAAIGNEGGEASISVEGDSASIAVEMPSGAAYNETAGVMNVAETSDGVVRIASTVENLDTGETAAMDVRIDC